MHVLHVTSVFAPTVGGTQSYIRELAAYLFAEHGITSEVCVCVPDLAGMPTRYKVDDVDVSIVECRGNLTFKLLPDMSVWAGRCDIVHLHDNQVDGICLHFAMRNYGKPVVLTTHGGFMHQNRLRAAKAVYQRLVAPYILRRFQRIIASGPGDAEAFGRMSGNVVRIDNGIDYARFAAFQSPVARRTALLTVGRLARHKRVDRLIDAVCALRQQGYNASLDVVGPDADDVLTSLQRQVSERECAGFVRLAGALDAEEFAQAYRQAKFFVTATEYEGFGLAIFEAMSAGLIPVVNRIFPLTGLIDDGQNGFIVDFANPESSVAALKRIIELPESRLDEIRSAAMARASEFSWSSVARKVVDVYRESIAARPTAR